MFITSNGSEGINASVKACILKVGPLKNEEQRLQK